ncbi:DUF1338 domain-containing protein [Saccharicrinis fermentans]|uniref:2-oxoadipate dioxygenase/decarboxylase n=1 Tax=Saccharicrinis fermentans DSM 9555 = JCM 21142 TaxID=869213 RepID=W7Y5P2_9BACT|nr:DUF1338 domain-containing protein [Saccharicrinis fermentans]GAF03467.1 hypothetical protein JCM21142_52143 [Saccharicrinis fermentans DSM 9555 = JCM 21142]
MDLQAVFSRLFADYISLNPSVGNIHSLLKSENEEIRNDHIAFRTYNLPKINIDVLAKAFEVRGYKEKGNYRFKEKKLTAKHYENDKIPHAPKIFISQLECKALSQTAQKLINKHYLNLLHHLSLNDELIFAHNPVPNLSYRNFEQLRAESEYAAWLYVHGFRANHFTVLVNPLKSFSSLEMLNDFLTKNAIELNSAGGIIKGSKEQFLKQSSTLADKVMIDFIEGRYEIPACYYEFAERFTLPDGQLFQGFITGSADKIFESTHYRK